MLCCRAGNLSQYAFCPVRHERDAALPADRTFVVASSGVTAEKSGAARDRYNRLSLAASTIFELWRGAGEPGETLGQAVRRPGAPDRIREVLSRSAHPLFTPKELSDRFEQFLLESETIVPGAAEAVATADDAVLGAVVARSQSAAERLLGNQTPETTALVASARTRGAIAASAFGAGFGGSVWAFVERDGAESFRTAWQDDYRRSFPNAAASSDFFATRAGPARLRL
jgi:galactokinase